MLKDIINQHPPVHTRDISLSTLPHKGERIIVHGELKDRRHVPIVDILGRPKTPGTIHHITVDILIEPDPLRIVRAEAEMITVPVEQCPETLDVMEKLIGLEIRPGFSQKVRTLVGGANGCAHLCTLVKAMGTEIVHGWLTRKRSQSPLQSIPLEDQRHFLMDSCRLWRKDGPKYKEISQIIQRQCR